MECTADPNANAYTEKSTPALTQNQFKPISAFATTRQDSQCTYNVTLRRDLETIVAVEKQQVLHIACFACMRVPGSEGMCMRIRAYSLANPARDAYVPYCDVICGPS
jgi:hypothetical protein